LIRGRVFNSSAGDSVKAAALAPGSTLPCFGIQTVQDEKSLSLIIACDFSTHIKNVSGNYFLWIVLQQLRQRFKQLTELNTTMNNWHIFR